MRITNGMLYRTALSDVSYLRFQLARSQQQASSGLRINELADDPVGVRGATLLKAGMPLVQSLDILRRRVEAPVFRSVLDDIHERVRSGSSLSDAFGAQEGLFPGVYEASLMAGEKSGTLEPVLRRYVAYAKVLAAVRRKTLSALIYPAIMLFVGAAGIGIFFQDFLINITRFLDTFKTGHAHVFHFRISDEAGFFNRFDIAVEKHVRADELADLFNGVTGSNELLAGGNINAVQAGEFNRRRIRSEINLFGTGFPHHGDDFF